jgi:formylglycine-generating enzyme required for sulfatase activity
MRTTFEEEDRDVELIAIEGATFLMGSSMEEVDRCVADWAGRLVDPTYTRDMFRSWIAKEAPAHLVPLAPFRIAKYPVTNRLYRKFIGATGRRPPDSIRDELPGDHPAWGMSVDDVETFIAWLNEVTGRDHRLPTEAEWEYAARGPSHIEYPFGNAFDAKFCNTVEAGIGSTTPVDRYAAHASPFGICDMAGNVEEWTSTNYAPYPGGTFVDDHLTQNLGNEYRVLRGGAYTRGGDLTRCARRHGPIPDPRFRYGFRLAASAPG